MGVASVTGCGASIPLQPVIHSYYANLLAPAGFPLGLVDIPPITLGLLTAPYL
jgi:hypothetical protein